MERCYNSTISSGVSLGNYCVLLFKHDTTASFQILTYSSIIFNKKYGIGIRENIINRLDITLRVCAHRNLVCVDWDLGTARPVQWQATGWTCNESRYIPRRVGDFSLLHNDQIGLRFHPASYSVDRVQLKCEGTRWRTGGEVKGNLANGVSSQYPSHYLGTWCIQHYYRWCAHLGCQ